MICPVVCYSGGFVGGMGYVSHIEIYSNWNATGTSGVLLHSMPFENYYVNAPYICQDTNGAFYATFDQGSGDVSLDRVVYAAYRNGSGQWQYPVSVVAGTNDGATAYNAGVRARNAIECYQSAKQYILRFILSGNSRARRHTYHAR